MKKRFVAISLIMAMAATTAACGAGASNNTPASSSSSSETEAPAEEDTEADEAADTEVASSDIEVTGDNRTLALFAGSIPENTPTGVGLEAMAGLH